MNIYEVFKEFIWQPDDLTGVVWYEDGGNLMYNNEGDLEDLFNGNGETYSYQVLEDVSEMGLRLVVLADDCGGESFQAILKLSNKQDQDKYWNSFGDSFEESLLEKGDE